MLKKITQNCYLNFFTGIILLATSGYEIYHSIGEAKVGAHHGIAIFALVQVLKSIPEIMHGLQELQEGENLK